MAEAKTKKPAAARTAKKQNANLKPFKPGAEWTGNAKGRPKGSRNKLGEAFLADLLEEWEEHGKAVIEKVRRDKPDVLLKTVASILPQQVEVKNPERELTDDELDAALSSIARLHELLGPGPEQAGARQKPAARRKRAPAKA